MLRLASIALLASACLTSALPAEKRAVADAPFSTPTSTLQGAIVCPNGTPKGSSGSKGGVVLLVHGTGSTGSESWASGPYVKVLPTIGKKYDVCYVNLPNRSLVDAQLSAEYVAYAIKYLAPLSYTGKVSAIGHSQGGGLNIQWPLIFWPSIQPLVSNYIGLAPDFKGTADALLLCQEAYPVPSCQQSLWQQKAGSRYLGAQNSLLAGGGGRALVPTTSIYTLTDEVITPEPAVSTLQGAKMKAVQELCGPLHVADHFTMVVDIAAFGLVKATLEGTAFDPRYCLYLVDNPAPDFSSVAPTLQAVVGDVLAIATGPRVAQEPPLQPYVCSRGFATQCGPAFA